MDAPLTDVAPFVRALAERGADVVPLLNGVTAADELIAAGVPRERMLGGIARVSATRTEPGVVQRMSGFRSIVLGELAGGSSDRAAAIARAIESAGLEARASDNMPVELWQKFVFITRRSAPCATHQAGHGSSSAL